MTFRVGRLRWRLFERQLMHFTDSIWFFPLLLAVAALGLFVLTNGLDQGHWLPKHRWQVASWLLPVFFTGDASTAQFLLSAIATMWATVIGITFSVTLVTVQLTATKYIAQVLPLFERNRTNQLVLGTYLGIVIYALLVLCTVRFQPPHFVPGLGVAVAVVLSVIALLMLIGFISNIINFVRPGSFLEVTAVETMRSLKRAHLVHQIAGVETLGDAGQESEFAERNGPLQPIGCERRGLLTSVLWDDFCRHALAELKRMPPGSQRWLVHFHRKVGDRLQPGDALAHFYAPHSNVTSRRLMRWVRLAHEVAPVRRPREDADYGLEVLGGVTVKGVIQGDLDVAFEGVDYLIELLPLVARQPEMSWGLQLVANGNVLEIRRPPVDLLGKLIRELTLASEVALAQNGFRPLAEGISRRLVSSLVMMAEEGDWSAFLRVLSHVEAWYQSSFFHMDWINGMRHLAGDLTELMLTVQARGYQPAILAMHELLEGLRDRMMPDSQASEVLRDVMAKAGENEEL